MRVMRVEELVNMVFNVEILLFMDETGVYMLAPRLDLSSSGNNINEAIQNF